MLHCQCDLAGRTRPLERMNGAISGYSDGMLDAREPKDNREQLLAETLWSLGLFMAVAFIVVLISVIGPG